MAGVKFQHIHYRGSAPAVQDLAAGNVDVAFDNIGAAGSLIRPAGFGRSACHRKATGVAAGRADGEGHRPGLRRRNLVRAGRAAEGAAGHRRESRLHADINEALGDPEVKKKLENLSAEVSTASLAETAAFFKAEIETWRNVIKRANVRLEQ